MKTKLSPRLRAIFNLIDSKFDEIWDTCCDHGLLGLALLESKKASKIHFVDSIPKIMEKLESRIDSLELEFSHSYELHTLKAEKIKITSPNSLISICGVGGDLAIGILSEILKNNDLSKGEVLISAQYHIFELRKFLKDHGFKLIKEELTFEGSRGYELLLVGLGKGSEIDPVGSALFDANDEKVLSYFKNLVNHYEKKTLGDEDYRVILKSYEKLLK